MFWRSCSTELVLNDNHSLRTAKKRYNVRRHISSKNIQSLHCFPSLPLSKNKDISIYLLSHIIMLPIAVMLHIPLQAAPLVLFSTAVTQTLLPVSPWTLPLKDLTLTALENPAQTKLVKESPSQTGPVQFPSDQDLTRAIARFNMLSTQNIHLAECHQHSTDNILEPKFLIGFGGGSVPKHQQKLMQHQTWMNHKCACREAN